MPSPSFSHEPIGTRVMSVRDRARNWQAGDTVSTESQSELPPPPTIEEIEEMERAAAEEKTVNDDNVCHTPSGSSLSAPINKQQQQYSRQVSRVSGMGRTVRAAAPRPIDSSFPRSMAAAAAEEAAAAAEKAAAAAAVAREAAPGRERRGRSPPSRQRDFSSRRSISVDDPNRRPRQQRSRGQHPAVAPTNGAPLPRRKNAGGKQQTVSFRVEHEEPNNSASTRKPVVAKGGRGRGGRTRGAPYTAHGTPSAAAGTNNRTRQQQQQQQQQQQEQEQRPRPAPASTFGGSHNFDITTTSPPAAAEVAAPKLRRHNSAPDMGVMDVQAAKGEKEDHLPFHDEPRQVVVGEGSPPQPEQAPCWGGGLPPTCGPAAARAAAAAAEAAAQQSRAAGSTAGSSRYPGTDRESFARTLNEEELDEVWKGLGEGVSQRGCGSEVACDLAADGANVPASPSGTAVSGAFPMLTANVLERHDQLADGCGGGSGSGGGNSPGKGEGGGRRVANVMPMPKQIGDRTVEDMENGTRRSSKKSKGSSSSRSDQPQQQQTTLLGAIVSTVILGLWVAHLVFNVLLLWPIIVDHYVWAVCFVPGVLGILLSFNSFRKSHRHCKPVADDEAEADAGPCRRRRSGPHPCALPCHTILLLSVVACLGMHASDMLFCKNDMILVFDEATLEPLCDESLTLPIVLDGVLLLVASLKASSLCWAWVLN